MEKKRIEVALLLNTELLNFKEVLNIYDIISVYFKVDLSNLSSVRKELIDIGYTTRLFVVLNDNKKEEYIYGKLKGKGGVFNEKCKNSVWRKPIENVIDVSSNNGAIILIDNPIIKSNYDGDRLWLMI